MKIKFLKTFLIFVRLHVGQQVPATPRRRLLTVPKEVVITWDSEYKDNDNDGNNGLIVDSIPAGTTIAELT